MICIDSNILIYAFNKTSAFHTEAKKFIESQVKAKKCYFEQYHKQ